MLLEFRQVVEGIDTIQFARVDQTHKQIAYAGAVLGFVKVRVLR